MSSLDIVTRVFKKADVVHFDDDSNIVLMSDCHRGDGSWADNFLKNRNIFFAALTHYYNRNYTYIELGDGDELWENKKLSDIMLIHKDAFWLMSKFHEDGRLYLLYGNHDMEKKYYKYMKNNLKRYYTQREEEPPFNFNNIKAHEGLVLKHRDTGDKIFLIHGHQVDTLNGEFWMVAKFLVRYLWKPLETFGVNDPTSAAKNYEKKISIAKELSRWVMLNRQMLIAGHNHKPMFPEVGQTPYFNDGSCIHPRCITAIEISQGNICLVKWSVKARVDGVLYIDRDVLAGPRRLQDYFNYLNWM